MAKFTPMIRLSLALFSASLALLPMVAPAAFITPNLPGNTSDDGWDDLNSAPAASHGGGFPGAIPWTSPIASNQPTGSGQFTKTSGNGFPATDSIYIGGFSNDPNTLGGAFSVFDDTPVSGLETVIFQIRIGEAFGYDFFNHVAPTLNYNDGSQALAAPFSALLLSELNGTFTNPETGQEEPVYINTWAFQWDLSGVSEPISGFSINWSAVQHAQIYALQLNEGDTFTQVIPEPSSMALLVGALGVGGFFMVRRRLHSLSL